VDTVSTHGLVHHSLGLNFHEAESKTPDMWLKKGETAILSELKTPELHFDLGRGLFLFQTGFSKLAKFLHKSVKQLRAIDQHHEHPWLVIFVSYNFQFGFEAFINALQGGFAPGDGNIYPPGYKGSRPHKQILEDVKNVDAVLWLQGHEGGENFYAGTLGVLQITAFIEDLELFALDMESVIPDFNFSFQRTTFNT